MKIQGKKVLLLMDNFSAHELGVELLEEAQALTNTKVMWLPPNATSVHQPLDQGIIQNWKSYVKKQFVTFMADTFDAGKDLSKEMHVLRAIRWGISALEQDVTPETIQNCWSRSQCINFGQFPLPPSDLWAESQQVVEDIQAALNRLHQQGAILKVPNIREYISPYAEQVHDDALLSGDDLVDEIVANHSPAEEEEPELEDALPPPITHNEALKALHILRRYKEENVANSDSGGNFSTLLRELRAEERDITSKQHGSMIQRTLYGFFTPMGS